MLLVSLDQYIVVVALPDIGRDLGYTPQSLQTVISAYAVASSAFLLLGGRASDVLGRRRVFVSGLVLYLFASALGGMAASQLQQLASRAVQGLGGALIFPSTIAIINVRFREGPTRNFALGVWAGAGAAGLVVGVLLGGVLTSMLGWRWVFFINVPLAGLVIILAFFVIERDGTVNQKRKFGFPAAATATAAIAMIVILLVEGPALGWLSGWSFALLLGGLAMGAIFVRIERQSSDPLVSPSTLASPWVRFALVVAVLFMATFGALLYFLSIFFQDVLGFAALQTGLAFLLPTTIIVASSAMAGSLVTRIGLKKLMVLGLSIGSAGALYLGFHINTDSSFLSLVPGMVAVSVADGAVFTATFIAATTGIPDSEQGVASGVVSTGQGVGAVTGLALLVLMSNTVAQASGSTPGPSASSLGIASSVYAIGTGMLITMIYAAAFSPKQQKS